MSAVPEPEPDPADPDVTPLLPENAGIPRFRLGRWLLREGLFTRLDSRSCRSGSCRAILMMLGAGFFMASMAATVKQLTDGMPVPEVLFFRNVTGAIMISVILAKRRISPLGNNRRVLLLRGAFGTLGLLFFFYAISNMALADAVVLNKFSPFFVIIFAALFLGERMKRLQLPALLLAILGLLFISKPRLDYSFMPAASALLSALFAGAAYTTLRHLRHTETPLVVVFYLTMVASLSMIPFMIYGFWKTPDFMDILLILAVGSFALVGQHLMTSAYRYAEAGEVAIYGYSNVLFALVLGIALWSEFPDALSLGGVALVISGAYLNARSGLANRTVPGEGSGKSVDS